MQCATMELASILNRDLVVSVWTAVEIERCMYKNRFVLG